MSELPPLPVFREREPAPLDLDAVACSLLGWRCPSCERCYSPHVLECLACAPDCSEGHAYTMGTRHGYGLRCSRCGMLFPGIPREPPPLKAPP